MKRFIPFFISLVAAVAASAQPTPQPAVLAEPGIDVADSLLAVYAQTPAETTLKLPPYFFMPAVYDTFRWFDAPSLNQQVNSGIEQLKWVEDAIYADSQMKQMQQHFFFTDPAHARYNIALLPEAPKRYQATVNPQDHTIEITEIINAQASDVTSTIQATDIKHRHWLRTFNASLQFSQAYVSPNWYQGGNNNLNALGQLYYNVKLNQKLHPNLLFESTFQYKLGITNAPDDQCHSYSVSEDIFQINSTFGVKAAKHWYYSVNGQFKTQLVNSYTANSWTLRSALLSPAELNAGLGMTYNLAKPRYTLDISIAPLSYNMTICTNDKMDKAAFGIAPGKSSVHKFGSTAEVKLGWQISHNISLKSRLYGFTDYSRIYADWENTLAFEINRFLTTQINVNMRYDTSTPPVADTKWKKLQVKEILSIGFAYKFSSL